MFKINDDITFREVDGHLVVVNLQTGFYHSLNESATFIFQLIRQNKDTSEILREMCQRYELPEEKARRDLEECIESLVKEQVLVEPKE